MSILIKGMEMPKDGDAVVIVISNENGIIKAEVDEYCGAVYETVPVPTPHGRLGDIDAIKTDIYSKEERAFAEYNQNPDDEYLEGIKDGLHMAAKRLSVAPTIIEAEGEENGTT